jgi:hypothetical protein
MQGFRSPGNLQRLTAVFSAVRNLFVPAAPSLPPVRTASMPWRNGELWPTSLFQRFRRQIDLNASGVS